MSTAVEDPVVCNGDRPWRSDQEGSEGREEEEQEDAAAGTGGAGGDYDDDHDVTAEEDGEHDKRTDRPPLSLEDHPQGSTQGAGGIVSQDDGALRDQDGAAGGGGGGERGQAEDSGNASSNSRSGNSGGGGGDGGQGGGGNLSGLARGQPADDSDDGSNADGDVALARLGGSAGVPGQGEMGEEFQADRKAGPPSSVGGGSPSGNPAAGLGESGREEVWDGGSVSDRTEEVMSPRSLDSMSSKDQLPWLEPSEVMRHMSSVEGRDRETQAVIDALQEVYREKLKPIEQLSMLGKFHYDVMVDAELQAKPQVLLLGHYSTGKTSMIRHFIGRDFPGMHIGPEPSPGVFQVVMAGTAQRTVKGSALCILDELPYASLGKFGAQFLGNFQASIVPSPLLEHVNFVDTPGIVSPGKHGTARGFPFPEVVKWFAERSDLILLVFDAHKLDMGQEFREVMSVIAKHGDRVRVVLNKGQEVDSDRLMKVYGALMWSIGRCLGGKSTAPRVYVGSFWNGPRRHPDDSPEDDDDSFDRDEAALLKEITDLPKNVGVRKIDDMMQRAKVVKIHLLLVYAIRARMPRLWGAAVAQDQILLSLEDVFEEVKKKEGILQADMPDVEEYRYALRRIDLRDLPRRNRRLLTTMDDIIDRDIKQCVTQAGGVRRIYKLDPAARVEGILRPPSNSRRATMGGGGARGGMGSLGAALFPGRSSIAGGGDRRRRRASMRGRTEEEWSDSSGGFTGDEGNEGQEGEREEGNGGLALSGSGNTGEDAWLLFGVVMAVLVVVVGVAVALSMTGVLPGLPELPGWLLSLKPSAFGQ